VAVVVMNRTEHAPQFLLRIDGLATVVNLPPRSIASFELGA
jgi:glucosylceramidase